MSLQNFWLYGMVVGNSLVTVGTALKITLAFKGVRRQITTYNDNIPMHLRYIGISCETGEETSY